MDLCLPVFLWAMFRKHNSAVKMPALLDFARQHSFVHPHPNGNQK
jgi:hypothetical protein